LKVKQFILQAVSMTLEARQDEIVQKFSNLKEFDAHVLYVT